MSSKDLIETYRSKCPKQYNNLCDTLSISSNRLLTFMMSYYSINFNQVISKSNGMNLANCFLESFLMNKTGEDGTLSKLRNSMQDSLKLISKHYKDVEPLLLSSLADMNEYLSN